MYEGFPKIAKTSSVIQVLKGAGRLIICQIHVGFNKFTIKSSFDVNSVWNQISNKKLYQILNLKLRCVKTIQLRACLRDKEKAVIASFKNEQNFITAFFSLFYSTHAADIQYIIMTSNMIIQKWYLYFREWRERERERPRRIYILLDMNIVITPWVITRSNIINVKQTNKNCLCNI